MIYSLHTIIEITNATEEDYKPFIHLLYTLQTHLTHGHMRHVENIPVLLFDFCFIFTARHKAFLPRLTAG